MKKWNRYDSIIALVFTITVLAFLAGCTSKTTYVSINLENETECEETAPGQPSECTSINYLNLKADGAVFDTDTDQTTDGQVPVSLYGANSATGGQTNPTGNFTPTIQEVLDAGKEGIKKIFSEKEKVKVPIVEPAPIVLDEEKEKVITEALKYHGRFNGDRATFYAANRMKDYPASFTVTILGCGTIPVNKNNGDRAEYNGYIIKQSDVSGRGMAVVAPASCKSTDATIRY